MSSEVFSGKVLDSPASHSGRSFNSSAVAHPQAALAIPQHGSGLPSRGSDLRQCQGETVYDLALAVVH